MSITPSTLIPAILFLFFWLFAWRRWDKKQPEPLPALLIATIFGGAAAWLLYYFGQTDLYQTFKYNLQTGLILTAILAVAEELLKLLGFVLGAIIYRRQLNQLVDCLVYGAATALGFALVENLLYFANFETSAALILFRSVTAMFAHTLFTGIFAFYLGIAFAPMKIRDREIHIMRHQHLTPPLIFWDFLKALLFHITRRHVLIHRPSAHGHRYTEIIFEGFWLAVISHFLYNAFSTSEIAGRTLAFLIPILISLLAIFAFSLFQHPWYLKVIGKNSQ